MCWFKELLNYLIPAGLKNEKSKKKENNPALIETMTGLSEALVDACAAGELGVVARLLNQHADPSIGAPRNDGLALCVPLVEASRRSLRAL